MEALMQAIILAGGKGTRLMPYTATVPKPLMPIGDMPILDILVRQLKNHGVTSIIMAVGHLHHMIEAYFKDGADYGIQIKYSLEKQALGTAGPLGLVMDELEDNFLVLNGDLLTTIDFKKLFEKHLSENAAATIATFPRTVDIDFGVVELDENSELFDFKEKPSLKYKVSMGINVFQKHAIQPLIKTGSYLDIPELMMILKNKNQKVYCYQEKCKWLDIGRVDDYSLANEIFESNKSQFLPGF
jgi:NDP-sugar pyrophosphorylase family protein